MAGLAGATALVVVRVHAGRLVSVEAPSWQCGTIDASAVLQHSYKVRNWSAEPVRLVAAQTDCSCFAATRRTSDLAGGGTGSVLVTFDPALANGPTRRRLVLRATSPVSGEPLQSVVLEVRANVIPRVVVSPLAIDFGEFDAVSGPRASVRLVADHPDDLDGLRATTRDGRLSVMAHRTAPTQAVAVVRVSQPLLGPFDTQLRLYCRGVAKGGLPVAVRGEVCSPWQPEDREIFFGFLRRQAGPQAAALRVKGLQADEITVARSDDRTIIVTTRALTASDQGSLVQVTVDPRRVPPGPLQAVVRVATPEHSLLVPLVGTVEDPRDCHCP
ncbi:MAG: DUF1573 domain-containing protein [Fimbriimonadaceae bacterium]|nr:DUF1573 domain-containing protein [Fimbriimonadaceae bacterium]